MPKSNLSLWMLLMVSCLKAWTQGIDTVSASQDHITAQQLIGTADNQVPDSLLLHPAKDNVNCLYGFKNHKKEWVIKPQYSSYRICGKYYLIDGAGVMDGHGKTILPFEYQHIRSIGNCDQKYSPNDPEPVFIVRKGDLWGIVNVSNEVVLPIEYDEIHDFKAGVALAKKGNLYGLATEQGLLLAPSYPYLAQLHTQGYVLYGDSAAPEGMHFPSQVGLLDAQGKPLIPCHYTSIFTPSHTELICALKDKLIDLYDKNGKLLMKGLASASKEDIYFMFEEQVAVFQKDKKWGLVDRYGKFILPFSYDSVAFVGNTYSNEKNTLIAIALKKGKWQGIRKEGFKKGAKYQLMYPLLLQNSKPYEQHKQLYGALVKKKGKYGVVDAKDSILLPLVYDTAYLDYSESLGEELLYLIKNKETKVYNTYNLTSPLDLKDLFVLPASLASHAEALKELPDGQVPILTNSHKVGLYDPQAQKLIIDTIYDAASFPDNDMNLAWVKTFIDPSMEENSPEQGDGEAVMVQSSEEFLIGGWHLIDYRMDTIYASMFDYPVDINDSLFVVYQEGKAGLLSNAGVLVLPCAYSEIEPDGMFYRLSKDKNQGLANRNGQIIFETSASGISPFIQGYAMYEENDLWGIVDSVGHKTIPAKAKKAQELISYLMKLGLREEAVDGLMAYTRRDRNDVSITYIGMDTLAQYFSKHPNLVDTTKLQQQIEKDLMANGAADDYGTYCVYPGWNYLSAGEDVLHLVYDQGRWGEVDFDNMCASHTKEMSVEVLGWGQQHLSYKLISTDNYSASRGAGSTQTKVKYYNYQFIHKDSLRALSLYDLIREGVTADKMLNALLIAAIQKLEGVELDCSNPEAYLSRVSDRFALKDNGLAFYLYNEDDFRYYGSDLEIELLIPYTSLKSISHKKGLLNILDVRK